MFSNTIKMVLILVSGNTAKESITFIVEEIDLKALLKTLE
jgi:hypothetical protein